jgi:hypothetical protein
VVEVAAARRDESVERVGDDGEDRQLETEPRSLFDVSSSSGPSRESEGDRHMDIAPGGCERYGTRVWR